MCYWSDWLIDPDEIVEIPPEKPEIGYKVFSEEVLADGTRYYASPMQGDIWYNNELRAGVIPGQFNNAGIFIFEDEQAALDYRNYMFPRDDVVFVKKVEYWGVVAKYNKRVLLNTTVEAGVRAEYARVVEQW